MTVPVNVSTPIGDDVFVAGGGLPTITRTAQQVTDQSTLNALIAAAIRAGISLELSPPGGATPVAVPTGVRTIDGSAPDSAGNVNLAGSYGPGGSAGNAPNLRNVYIDKHGADPTGATSSDAAWTAVYAEAVALLAQISSGGPYNGVQICFGAGMYKFSVDVLRILDRRIGMWCPGEQVTSIFTTGSNGKLFYAVEQNPTGAGGKLTAPIGGFTLFGWLAGANVIGMHMGCRPQQEAKGISVVGFNGAGSISCLFRNDNDAQGSGSGMEGSDIRINVAQGGSNDILFDGSVLVAGVLTADIGTFDYGRWMFHAVSVTHGQSVSMVAFKNGAHMYGGSFQLTGNINSNNALYTATVFDIGSGGNSKMVNCTMHVAVECDTSTGTVTDWTLSGNGTGGNAGIIDCHGLFKFLTSSGTFTRGTVTSSRVRISGVIDGPSVTTTGQPIAFHKRAGVCDWLDTGTNTTTSDALAQEQWFGQNLAASGIATAIGSTGMGVSVNGNSRTGQFTITTGATITGDFSSRTIADGATTSGSAVVGAASAATTDVNKPITGPGVPAGTTVLSVVVGVSVTMSANATATASGVTMVIGGGLIVANLNMPSSLAAGNSRLKLTPALDPQSAKIGVYGQMASKLVALIGFANAPLPNTKYTFTYDIIGQN